MEDFCMKKVWAIILEALLIISLFAGNTVIAKAETPEQAQAKSIVNSMDLEDLLYEGMSITTAFRDTAENLKRMLCSFIDSSGVQVSGNTFKMAAYLEYFYIKVNDSMNVVEFIYEDPELGEAYTFVSQTYSYGSAPEPKESSSPAHEHNFQWQTITEPTKDCDGLEGEVCSCGATGRTQPLSAYVYSINEYAVPMINSAKAGQTVTFEFGEWNSFPKSFMEKIATKSMEGVTFVFHYKWNHVKQEITIPFGTAVDTGFDWYGLAKMAELYGMN